MERLYGIVRGTYSFCLDLDSEQLELVRKSQGVVFIDRVIPTSNDYGTYMVVVEGETIEDVCKNWLELRSSYGSFPQDIGDESETFITVPSR